MLSAALTVLLCVMAQPDAAVRLGVAADLKTYPQSTPKETLASVLKAVEAKKIDYVVAQLADPQVIDQRLKDNGGKFDEIVQEARARLLDDPSAVKLLERFLKEGDWKVEENQAVASLKEGSDRRVFFRKAQGRWYLQNRQREKEKK